MKKKRLTVTVSLTPQLDKYLDKERGVIGKSTYIRQLLFNNYEKSRKKEEVKEK